MRDAYHRVARIIFVAEENRPRRSVGTRNSGLEIVLNTNSIIGNSVASSKDSNDDSTNMHPTRDPCSGKWHRAPLNRRRRADLAR